MRPDAYLGCGRGGRARGSGRGGSGSGLVSGFERRWGEAACGDQEMEGGGLVGAGVDGAGAADSHRGVRVVDRTRCRRGGVGGHDEQVAQRSGMGPPVREPGSRRGAGRSWVA